MVNCTTKNRARYLASWTEILFNPWNNSTEYICLSVLVRGRYRCKKRTIAAISTACPSIQSRSYVLPHIQPFHGNEAYHLAPAMPHPNPGPCPFTCSQYLVQIVVLPFALLRFSLCVLHSPKYRVRSRTPHSSVKAPIHSQDTTAEVDPVQMLRIYILCTYATSQ